MSIIDMLINCEINLFPVVRPTDLGVAEPAGHTQNLHDGSDSSDGQVCVQRERERERKREIEREKKIYSVRERQADRIPALNDSIL